MVSPKSAKFRTKEEIASDVAFILGAPITLGTKYAVVNNALWRWTEFDGKKKGCRFWSEGALGIDQSDKSWKSQTVHEHVVPRKVVAEMLINLGVPSETEVFELFKYYAIAAVVTKQEDKILSGKFKSKMPPEFDNPSSELHLDVWARYRLCGIQVVDTLSSGTLVT